jgi:hypothetical protein
MAESKSAALPLGYTPAIFGGDGVIRVFRMGFKGEHEPLPPAHRLPPTDCTFPNLISLALYQPKAPFLRNGELVTIGAEP